LIKTYPEHYTPTTLFTPKQNTPESGCFEKWIKKYFYAPQSPSVFESVPETEAPDESTHQLPEVLRGADIDQVLAFCPLVPPTTQVGAPEAAVIEAIALTKTVSKNTEVAAVQPVAGSVAIVALL
jgi:hypothetical protein